MTLRRRAVILTGLAAGAGAAGVFVFGAGPATLTLSDARVQPVLGRDDDLRVFVTILNTGGPDRLTGAALDGRTAEVVSDSDVVIPAGASPGLAADGAHLRLLGMASPGEGALLPLTLTFESAGRIATRALVLAPLTPGAAPDLGLLSLSGVRRVGRGEPAPRVSLDLTPDGDGWTVRVRAEQFHFSEPILGMGHVPGYGHGHLYLNGLKLQRMYGDTARIGALPPGRYSVSVTLNTNDHRAYVVDDVPVRSSFDLRVI